MIYTVETRHETWLAKKYQKGKKINENWSQEANVDGNKRRSKVNIRRKKLIPSKSGLNIF